MSSELTVMKKSVSLTVACVAVLVVTSRVPLPATDPTEKRINRGEPIDDGRPGPLL
jgi:hypothetical protein